jgi:arylsulfatase A-like enzyme
MVLVTTDHGEYLGDHWGLNKDGFYEQSYHIPLIVRNPARECDGVWLVPAKNRIMG